MEVIMRKALMIASLTAFAAFAAFAAPRNSDVPAISSADEEIVVNPSDDGAVSDFTKPVDENSQGFGRSHKQKRAKR
jgi:hypothetical protein